MRASSRTVASDEVGGLRWYQASEPSNWCSAADASGEAQVAALDPDRAGRFPGEAGKPEPRRSPIAERKSRAAEPEDGAIPLGERPELDQLRDLAERQIGRALGIGAAGR